MAAEGGNGASWFQRWLPVGAAAVVVGGVIATYFIGQGATQNTISNLQIQVSVLQGKINKDESKIGRLEGEVAASKVFNCQQFSVIEVQMGTVETLLNKSQVVNERDFALLWEKSYGSQFPNIFYPISIPHESPRC